MNKDIRCDYIIDEIRRILKNYDYSHYESHELKSPISSHDTLRKILSYIKPYLTILLDDLKLIKNDVQT